MTRSSEPTGREGHTDAEYQVCDRCGRKSWAEARTAPCGMPQPDGSRCTGTFRDPSPPDADLYDVVGRSGNLATAVEKEAAERLAEVSGATVVPHFAGSERPGIVLVGPFDARGSEGRRDG